MATDSASLTLLDLHTGRWIKCPTAKWSRNIYEPMNNGLGNVTINVLYNTEQGVFAFLLYSAKGRMSLREIVTDAPWWQYKLSSTTLTRPYNMAQLISIFKMHALGKYVSCCWMVDFSNQ